MSCSSSQGGTRDLLPALESFPQLVVICRSGQPMLARTKQQEAAFRQSATRLPEAARHQVEMQVQEEVKRRVEEERRPQATAYIKREAAEFLPSKTSLLARAEQGDTAGAAALLAAGEPPNARGEKGSTVLMGAAIKGHHDIVSTLLTNDDEVNAKDSQGWTALMHAAWKGHTETVRALLDGTLK